MKISKCLMVDVLTHMQIVATECSYNFACSWLESKGIKINEVISDYKKNRAVMLSDSGVFVFDEGRGYLLRD